MNLKLIVASSIIFNLIVAACLGLLIIVTANSTGIGLAPVFYFFSMTLFFIRFVLPVIFIIEFIFIFKKAPINKKAIHALLGVILSFTILVGISFMVEYLTTWPVFEIIKWGFN